VVSKIAEQLATSQEMLSFMKLEVSLSGTRAQSLSTPITDTQIVTKAGRAILNFEVILFV
jgi:hypothetical protein